MTRHDTPGQQRPPLSRDQIARWAVHRAPEAFFALLSGRRPDRSRTRRLDTQCAIGPWQADAIYHIDEQEATPVSAAETEAPRHEIWVVELQTRAAQRPPRRATSLLLDAAAQARVNRPWPRDGAPLIFLVEVRTGERAHPPNAHMLRGDDPSCGPVGAVDFVHSNRLLHHGPWSAALDEDVAAWPLWAFGREVEPEAIVRRMAWAADEAALTPAIADIKGLLRQVGRVRFPEDARFRLSPTEEIHTMRHATNLLHVENRLSDTEHQDLASAMARLQAEIDDEVAVAREQARREGQREGHMEGRREGHMEGRREGHMEGQRQALLDVVRAVAPDTLQPLQAIHDIDTLREAVTEVLSALQRPTHP